MPDLFIPSGSCNQSHPKLCSRDAHRRQQALSSEHGGLRAPGFGESTSHLAHSSAHTGKSTKLSTLLDDSTVLVEQQLGAHAAAQPPTHVG